MPSIYSDKIKMYILYQQQLHTQDIFVTRNFTLNKIKQNKTIKQTRDEEEAEQHNE